jgi:amino acid transporter
MSHDATSSGELHKGLKQRHLAMIAIGGVIGAGLFVGSGVVMNSVGPAAFLTYAITGAFIVMVMRMLGEMATANPATGSFADYARQALGGWAGFSVGWLYSYFWVIVVGFEAVAGGKIPSAMDTRRPAVGDRARPHAAHDRHQPVLGPLLRRVRVLGRQHQGRDDHGLHRARQPVRAGAVARP